jgi:transposase
MSKPKGSVVFKAYTQNQAMLLPPSLDELIAPDHPVRIVNQVLNKIDIEPLVQKYTGGGSSSFHPRMLLKVLVFAYII